MTSRHGHLPRVLLVAADLVAALAACAGAYVVRIPFAIVPVPGRTEDLLGRYVEALPIAVTVILAGVLVAGLYAREHLGRAPRIAETLRVATVVLALLSTAVLLYWRVFQYSRLTAAIATALFVPLFVLGRVVARSLLARMVRHPRYRSAAVVVGGGPPAEALASVLEAKPWMAIDVVAVAPVGETPPAWSRARRLIDAAEARRFLESGSAREVFVALPAECAQHLPAVLEELSQCSVDVRVVPDLGAARLVNASADVVDGVPLVSVRERPLYGLHAAAKRTIDVALSIALLLVLSPLLLLLAFLVAVSSRGGVLYRQERMGLDGRPFAMLKFRTMRAGAEEASGPVLARRGDPRVTPLGRVLRRLSLDELPQLWNVLRGEMSLVGPRPERAPFIRQFRARLPGYMLRQSVKAGMTGWAQVHGLRGDSSFEERLRYDLEYIDRWSLLLDLEILGRTAVQVVVGRNAC
jgi:exopolysaccharide biosynthesis polyprenyl glycosylphosphotransferase